MDKLTSSPTASSQCHVCNLCYEDRTKNRFPSLRCFFGFVFFWGESNQSWMGSNPPIPLDHYSPLGLKSKEMSFSNCHKLKWFMKEIALTLSWIFGTCQTSVGLLPSLQFSWLTFNPPNSTNNKDTLKERILCRVKQMQLFKGDTHIHTHTLLFLGKLECHLTKWILGALVSKDNWSLTDISDSVAHLLKVSQANSLNVKVKSLKTESSVARW